MLDARQVKTRLALEGALHRLLASTPLDAISVSELCREAGVHRTTFYAHAPTVYAFAIDDFTRRLDQISSVSVAPSETDTDEIAERYFESLVHLLEHVAIERTGYRALFGAAVRGAFRSVLTERLCHRAMLAIDVWGARAVPGIPASDQARAEASAFIAGGLVGVIETWAFGDDTDAAAAARRVGTLMPGWWPAVS
jgi:AcrR family transcriptional regulator